MSVVVTAHGHIIQFLVLLLDALCVVIITIFSLIVLGNEVFFFQSYLFKKITQTEASFIFGSLSPIIFLTCLLCFRYLVI